MTDEPCPYDGPCPYCGEMTQSVAGNPSLWPMLFPSDVDKPGVCQAHHTGCVMTRLAELDRLRADATRAINDHWPGSKTDMGDSSVDAVISLFSSLCDDMRKVIRLRDLVSEALKIGVGEHGLPGVITDIRQVLYKMQDECVHRNVGDEDDE